MMVILKAYGVRSNLLGLQNLFWENAKLVCCAGGCYGSPFAAQRGVTQGAPLSLLMFNVCVDAVVREWLHQAVRGNAARKGIRDGIVKWLVAFYIDNRLVASRDPVWLQSSFDILVSLFECIRLYTNAAKTKSWRVFQGGLEKVTRKNSTHYTDLGQKQPPTGSAARWSVRSVVSAYKLVPLQVIWRHSMTFIVCLSLARLLLLNALLSSTMLSHQLKQVTTSVR